MPRRKKPEDNTPIVDKPSKPRKPRPKKPTVEPVSIPDNDMKERIAKIVKRSLAGIAVLIVLFVGMSFALAGCSVQTMPSVNFGFKVTDSAGNYDESISSFEVGKRFYSCITVRILTNKKGAKDYKVEVTVPKTNEVEVKGMGGIEPDSNIWDEENEQTVMTFTIQGYKEATPEKILFYGTPTGEGEAKMMVHIYDMDGKEVNTGYSRTIFFAYELQD